MKGMTLMKNLKVRRGVAVLALLLMSAAPALAQRATTPPPPPPPAAPPQTVRPPAVAPARAGAPPVVMAEEVRPLMPAVVGIGHDSSAPRSWRTIRLEIAVTDTAAGAAKRTVTLMLVDGKRGSIRAENGPRILNADAIATLPNSTQIAEYAKRNSPAPPQYGEEGKILVDLTVLYRPQMADSNQAMLNESLSVVVPDGKLTMISQASDPTNDRKVTLEITATSIK
jgi:hypothetical protein